MWTDLTKYQAYSSCFLADGLAPNMYHTTSNEYADWTWTTWDHTNRDAAITHKVWGFSEEPTGSCHQCSWIVGRNYLSIQSQNFNGATADVYEWVTNFSPHFTMAIVTYLRDDWSLSMSVKEEKSQRKLRPEQSGCLLTDDIFKCISLNENHCILIKK